MDFASLSIVVGVVSDLRTEELLLGVLVLVATWAALRAALRSPKLPEHAKQAKRLAGWPIVGNTPELLMNMPRFNDWLVEKVNENGKTFVLELFGRPPTVVTADPANIEHVQKTRFENYVKGPRFHMIFEELLGDGIFNVDGDMWYHQRKTASHMFSVHNFRNHMEKVFQAHAEKVAHKLGHASTTNTTLDLQDLMYRYTLDGITEIAFGDSVDTLDSDKPVEFAVAFDTATGVLMRDRAPFPVWLWKIFRAFQTSSEQTIVRATEALDSVAYDIIARRKNVLENSDSDQRADLLSLFLKGGHQDEKYLRDMIMNFVIAGRDTTANALNWTFYCLYKNPEVQAKAVEEIERVLGDRPAGFDSLRQLKYLQAVFLETLRLYPSIAKNVRSAVEDDVLPDGTFVPAGGVVLYTAYVMGRDKDLWDNPEQYSPERWFGPSGDLIQRSPFIFNAFNGGPRICLGKTMATMEAIVLLATVLKRYRILPADEQKEVKQVSTLTLPMAGGHSIRVVPRS